MDSSELNVTTDTTGYCSGDMKTVSVASLVTPTTDRLQFAYL